MSSLLVDEEGTSSPTADFRSPANPHDFSLHHTMLRIKDPKVTIPFYEKHFGFQLLLTKDFPEWKFTLFFMGLLRPDSEPWPPASDPSSQSSRLWSLPQSCLEFTYNYGSESSEMNNGNVEPHRGFGHIAVMTPDVYAACASLESDGVLFKKRPDEGRMKGIAFALDPNGYWIEIIKRSTESCVPPTLPFTLAQAMIRVKDPLLSIAFYSGKLSMTVLHVQNYGDFTNYFLASLPAGSPHVDPSTGEAAAEQIRQMFPQVLELTHNHGTESSPSFFYHDGNSADDATGKRQGFGHVAFLCDDLNKACDELEKGGTSFRKRPEEGAMRGLAFALDPDGYSVELLQRGVGPILKE